MNFDTTKYKVWTWKHPLMLHWILNPGLAINELLLGQRVPKVLLIEKNKKKSFGEKGFIPCPHCNTIHSGLKWTLQNKTALGNWFGLYCDSCGGIIPCLRNLTSAALLIVTSPFWLWIVNNWKAKWLETQKRKFSQPLKLTTPEYNWVTEGLGFGSFMFVCMGLIFPLFYDEGFNPVKLLIGLVVWTLSGLLFGFVMKKLMFNKSQESSPDETQQAT
jgi:hypothetical protein